MGPPMVIEVQMLLKGLVDVGHLQFSGVEVPELTAGGGVSALDATVVLRSSRRQHIEGEVEVLAGGLELGHELRSAVDLDGSDGERHLLEEDLQEAGGVASGGAGVAAHDQLLAEGADGLELLELDPGKRVDPGVVDLDELAGTGGFHSVAPALSMAFLEVAAPFGAGPDVPGRKHKDGCGPGALPWPGCGQPSRRCRQTHALAAKRGASGVSHRRESGVASARRDVRPGKTTEETGVGGDTESEPPDRPGRKCRIASSIGSRWIGTEYTLTSCPKK